MTTEIARSMQNLPYKYKLSILVAIVFHCLGRLLLQGSGGEHEVFTYIAPAMAGGLAGCLIGYLFDNWQKALCLHQKVNVQLRKRIKKQREPDSWYGALFGHDHSIMILINPITGKIDGANPSACEFYGYPVDQLKQMHISEINILPQGENNFEMERTQTDGRQNVLAKHRLASGEERDVELFSGSIVIGGTSLLFLVVNDISQRKHLRGIIPICSHCKQIRDSDGDWHHLEEYIQRRSEARFSHGLCPPCARHHYPAVFELPEN